MQNQNTSSLTHMLAGASAGSAAVLVLHPFDVVKTRLQVQDGLPGSLPTYRGTLHAMQSILRSEGVRGFYRGLVPALLGSGISWGAYFAVYERIKSWHQQVLGVPRLSAAWHLLSAAEAGATVCLVTNPIWLIKTRMQLQRSATETPAGKAVTNPSIVGTTLSSAATTAAATAATTTSSAPAPSPSTLPSAPSPATPAHQAHGAGPHASSGTARSALNSHVSAATPTPHQVPITHTPPASTSSASSLGTPTAASCPPPPTTSTAATSTPSSSSSSSSSSPSLASSATTAPSASKPGPSTSACASGSAPSPPTATPASGSGSGSASGSGASGSASGSGSGSGSGSRMAASSSAAKAGRPVPYRNVLDAFVRIGREEGVRGYYKGLSPALLLQTTHGAVQFSAYEEMKMRAASWGKAPGEAERVLTSSELSLFGALSKLMASTVTYPTQVVRSRMQQRLDVSRSQMYTHTWQVVVVMWQREGVRGFYKGLTANLLRVMPQSALTLVMYENALSLVHRRATPDKA